jgi:AcrR family transcriptional regulator
VGMKTKDRILDVSIELFNKNGVVAITTNHIAKAMNISPGNLYFHYDNKEEIIQETVSQNV